MASRTLLVSSWVSIKMLLSAKYDLRILTRLSLSFRSLSFFRNSCHDELLNAFLSYKVIAAHNLRFFLQKSGRVPGQLYNRLYGVNGLSALHKPVLPSSSCLSRSTSSRSYSFPSTSNRDICLANGFTSCLPAFPSNSSLTFFHSAGKQALLVSLL